MTFQLYYCVGNLEGVTGSWGYNRRYRDGSPFPAGVPMLIVRVFSFCQTDEAD